MRNFRQIAIIICDIQNKTIKNLLNKDTVIKNINFLSDSKKYVKNFSLIINSELCPEKLGQSSELLNQSNINYQLSRTNYSIYDEKLEKILLEKGIQEIILVGMEIQWCINQSVRDLVNKNYVVNVPVDAVGNNRDDNNIPLKRLEGNGARLCLTEDIVAENLDNFNDIGSKWFLNYLKNKNK